MGATESVATVPNQPPEPYPGYDRGLPYVPSLDDVEYWMPSSTSKSRFHSFETRSSAQSDAGRRPEAQEAPLCGIGVILEQDSAGDIVIQRVVRHCRERKKLGERLSVSSAGFRDTERGK